MEGRGVEETFIYYTFLRYNTLLPIDDFLDTKISDHKSDSKSVKIVENFSNLQLNR